MKAQCDNCKVAQEQPTYLWRSVRYEQGVKHMVCPSCWEWAKRHPQIATALPEVQGR